jgi:transposase InsO family protein
MANDKLSKQMKQLYADSRGTYGSPRIHAALVAQGVSCGVHRVARLMRQHGLRARGKRRYRRTTDSSHAYPVAPNLLNRQFTASASNQKWVGDITYIPTGEGWLYLAAILDLYSRRVVGWAMDSSMSQQLTLSALKMAVQQRQPQAGLLQHTDRGRQYAAGMYQSLLRHYQMRQSMSRSGNCYDNAPMESFFATLKAELANYGQYVTRRQARTEIFEYIELFYNRQRRHSALGYLSPLQFELTAVTSTSLLPVH